MSPQRIQRKRTKGWRMPEGAVYVGRPTIYGNRFVVGNSMCPGTFGQAPSVVITVPLAVALYRAHVEEFDGEGWLDWAWADLAGRDLVCWCPPGQPCHADVLLEIANGGLS